MVILQYILFSLVWAFVVRCCCIIFDFILYLIYSPFTDDSPFLLADFMTSLSNEIMFSMIASGIYFLSIKQWVIGIVFLVLFYPIGDKLPWLIGKGTLYFQVKILKAETDLYKKVRPEREESLTLLSGQKYGISIAFIPIITGCIGIPVPIVISVIFCIFGLILWAYCTYFEFRKMI